MLRVPYGTAILQGMHDTNLGQVRRRFDAVAVANLIRDRRDKVTLIDVDPVSGDRQFEFADWYVEALGELSPCEMAALSTWNELKLKHDAEVGRRMMAASLRGDVKTYPEDFPKARSHEARHRAHRRRLAKLPAKERSQIDRLTRQLCGTTKKVDPVRPLCVALRDRAKLRLGEIAALLAALRVERIGVDPELAASRIQRRIDRARQQEARKT